MSEQYKIAIEHDQSIDRSGEAFFAEAITTFESRFSDHSASPDGFNSHGELTASTPSSVITVGKDIAVRVETPKDTIASKLAEHFYPDAVEEIEAIESRPTSTRKFTLTRANHNGEHKASPLITETYQLYENDGETEATYRRDVHHYDRRARLWQRNQEQAILEPFTESRLQEAARLLDEVRVSRSIIESQEGVTHKVDRLVTQLVALEVIPGGIR